MENQTELSLCTNEWIFENHKQWTIALVYEDQAVDAYSCQNVSWSEMCREFDELLQKNPRTSDTQVVNVYLAATDINGRHDFVAMPEALPTAILNNEVVGFKQMPVPYALYVAAFNPAGYFYSIAQALYHQRTVDSTFEAHRRKFRAEFTDHLNFDTPKIPLLDYHNELYKLAHNAKKELYVAKNNRKELENMGFVNLVPRGHVLFYMPFDYYSIGGLRESKSYKIYRNKNGVFVNKGAFNTALLDYVSNYGEFGKTSLKSLRLSYILKNGSASTEYFIERRSENRSKDWNIDLDNYLVFLTNPLEPTKFHSRQDMLDLFPANENEVQN